MGSKNLPSGHSFFVRFLLETAVKITNIALFCKFVGLLI